MPQQVQIYGLIDPRDRRIYYVGSSVDAFVRLDGHMRDGSDTPKTRWVSELKSAGIQPDLTILATVDASDRYTEEYKWIYLGKVSGWPLTNTAALKSDKYTHLADNAEGVLVVEVDKGLTWRKVKDVTTEAWTDDAAFLKLIIPAMSIIAKLALFGLLAMILGLLFPHVSTFLFVLGGFLLAAAVIIEMPILAKAYHDKFIEIRNDMREIREKRNRRLAEISTRHKRSLSY